MELQLNTMCRVGSIIVVWKRLVEVLTIGVMRHVVKAVRNNVLGIFARMELIFQLQDIVDDANWNLNLYSTSVYNRRCSPSP